jgi:hypothetical protein
MKEICFGLPFENIILLFLSTLHLSQVTHLCIAYAHNIHPSVLLRYKGATSCIQAAVMQSVKHEIIFLYFCYTVCHLYLEWQCRCKSESSSSFLPTIDIFSVVDYVNMFECQHAPSFSHDYWTVHRIVILSHSTHIICLVTYLIVLSTLCFMRLLCILKIIIMDFGTVRTFFARSEQTCCITIFHNNNSNNTSQDYAVMTLTWL